MGASLTRLVRRNRLYWAVWLCLGFGFYELLAGTYSLPELMVGLGSAAAGATAAVLARERAALRLRPGRPAAARLLPLPMLA
ncbi:MAG: hypothetical protein ACREPI_12800, partial [Candidatus Dormibacterales bacterium]